MKAKIQEILVGGQAVWEGVMMRSPAGIALAVRKADGGIETRELTYSPLARRHRIFRLPFFRGIGALWESFILGIRSLNLSLSLGGVEGEKLTPVQTAFSFALALGIVVILFFLVPFFLSRLFSLFLAPSWLIVLEGFLRFLIFFLYLWAISLVPEVRRVLFQYHGAEHKVVHAFEQGEDLTVENAVKYSTLHPRCSTSFLVVVLLISFIVFAFLDFPNLLWRISSRIFLLPFIAGLSYELIRFFTLHPHNPVARALIWPGLLTQKMTTAEPTTQQIEVAIAALKRSLKRADA